MPGRPMPPAMPAMRSRSSSLLRAMASLMAVMTRSWSISTSAGSTAAGSISTLAHLLGAGDDDAHGTATGGGLERRLLSSSCACAIWVCICCAIFAI